MDQGYRKIELHDIDELIQKTRNLDPEQRQIVDIWVRYAKDLKKSLSGNFDIPNPPRLKTNGGAGVGKSQVIMILSQWMEFFLRKPKDDPNMPYIIKVAFTGCAAINIDGQTLHNAFSFKFGNEFTSLSDKQRDKKRTLLRNLRVVIVDEKSMLTPDMLYLLHLRLCEITQCHEKKFGGIAIFLLGDLMQLPPPKGRYVYQKPINSAFHDFYDQSNLWESFDVLNLTTNHRQGNCKVYADLLNRMRVGKMTQADIDILKTRVRPHMNHADIPENALIVLCTNKEVNAVNIQKLDINSNEEHILNAINFCDTQENFKPLLEYGKVRNTPCLNELRLKVGAEVMLTYNIDICDSLANGSKGTVIDFMKNSVGNIRYILVQFHDNEAGKERRKMFPEIQNMYPDMRPTPIEKLDFSYSLSKKSYSNSSTAKVVQFPLSLAHAISGHKSQGATVKRPRALVTDLQKVWPSAKALAYVICSRVESIDQLFIIGDLPLKSFVISKESLEEIERLNHISIFKNQMPWYKDDKCLTKIACLNIRSLSKHFEDLKADYALQKSDIICLTETWIPTDSHPDFSINGFNSFFNNVGKGKGITIYAKSIYSHVLNSNGEGFQITKMTSSKMDVICVYRSSSGVIQQLISQLLLMLTPQKPTYICGDFNLCLIEYPTNNVTQSLKAEHFKSIVNHATHDKGGLLDHGYIKNITENYHVHLHPVYYSDHDCICVTFGINKEDIEENLKMRKTIFF